MSSTTNPRVQLIDRDGDPMDDAATNALKVKLVDTDVEITVVADELEIHLSQATDDILIYGNDYAGSPANQKLKVDSAGLLYVKSIADAVTVDCNSSAVTIDNLVGNAVYTRITDGSGVAAVNGDNELSVEINNIDGDAGNLQVKQAICATAVNAGVVVGTSTTEIISAIPARFSIDIVNDSDEIVYLGLEDAAVLNKGIRLNPNGGSFSSSTFTGVINGIAADNANVTVVHTV